MSKEKLTLEEAENIVDNMYQNRWKECGVEDGNTIHMNNLEKLHYSKLERASILLLRTEIRLKRENQELKKQLEEINNFISKAGFVNILQLMLDYCAKVEQQKEFIECLEKEIVDSRAGSGQQYYAQNHLRLYKEIIGKDINVSTKEAKNDG